MSLTRLRPRVALTHGADPFSPKMELKDHDLTYDQRI